MTSSQAPITNQVKAVFARIAELNPALNAFIRTFDEEALEQARVLDDELRRGHSRGPLHGKTISLKDLIDVKGVPTTAASRLRTGHIAAADATVVTRLRDAGAVLIGKNNLHEFALGTTSDESAFGPVRNPHDRERSAGGSSGGSAAAVAAGMGWASIGSDTGGSIRIPAAACGVVGLKPTFGEIPTLGVVPLSVSLDHIGPLARTVSDAWAVYSVMGGTTPPPPTSARPIGSIVIGRLDGYFLGKLDEDVRAQFERTIIRLREAGATIVDVDLGRVPDISTTYINVSLPEAYAYHAGALDRAPGEFTSNVRSRLETGGTISQETYVKAQGDRAVLRAAVDRLLGSCDALALPTLPILPQKIGASTVVIAGAEEPLRPLMLRQTQLFNLTGHPAISLPCGQSRDGLPCALQLVGRRQRTTDLLEIALSCEAIASPRAPSSSPYP